jgi:two-component system sensor histidine kinase KdpD
VVLEAAAVPAGVELRVVDHGPGVPADQRDRLFEPFQRLGDTGGTGVGLGLAVAHGFVAAMGGTIAADETPGGGLTMRLVLPVPAAPLAASAQDPSSSTSPTSTASPAEGVASADSTAPTGSTTVVP